MNILRIINNLGFTYIRRTFPCIKYFEKNVLLFKCTCAFIPQNHCRLKNKLSDQRSINANKYSKNKTKKPILRIYINKYG